MWWGSALLQEYGDRQLRENAPHWSLDARQNQVMKAVILNSADKVADSGDGLRQGMTRTIGDRQGGNWLTSEPIAILKSPYIGIWEPDISTLIALISSSAPVNGQLQSLSLPWVGTLIRSPVPR